MKIRTDFVTNSSSSSFVIAKNSSCTRDELLTVIRDMKKKIQHHLGAYHRDSSDGAVEEFIQDFVDWLIELPTNLQLNDWSVSALYCDNENGAQESFMFEHGIAIQTANFKVGSEYV